MKRYAYIPDWDRKQHYKNRRPPWIKLHRELLDDPTFMALSLTTKALLPLIWLVASEDDGGVVCINEDYLSFRLRQKKSVVRDAVSEAVDAGLLVDASSMLADCYQHATPEGETEAEGEGETYGSTAVDRFGEFWRVYPRKQGKKKARETWKRKHLDSKADEIIADVQARKQHDQQWLAGYIPNGSTYVNQERWQDEINQRRNGSDRVSTAERFWNRYGGTVGS